MFVVTFKLQGKPASRIEITQSLQGFADRVRKVEGCIEAQVTKDINDENNFLLVEKWQKQRNVDDHLKSSLFSALLGIEGLLVKPPEIEFLVEN